MKIKKGDTVIVTAGKDKGKQGVVTKVMPKANKVVAEGINTVKRHEKPSYTSAGGIVEKELPIHVSNVSLVDPESGKPTRVGFKIDSDGVKYRFAKKSGKRIDS
ncbi:MAG: 50S ribosomal protein L24 [Alphaproteobacteria bacterium]|nr:50S ribosomal protein L24 [Alphaproteobacteria bacterium]OJV16387.1 MAG: 50S ribosomal protein L24 [Alphaproteobacteria bacterium 33-17]